MGKLKALLLVLLVLLALSPIPSMFSTAQVGYRLVRDPSYVYSMQPVLVFAYVPSGSSVELEVEVNVEAKINVTELQQPPPLPTTVQRIPMLPVPWAPGWYVAHIPGLPAKSWDFTVKGLLRDVPVEFSIASKVTYRLIVDGSTVASDSYNVNEGEVSRYIPPFVYSFMYDVLKDPTIINETLGLGPHGWVTGGGESVRVLTIAFNDKSQPELSFEYKVSEASWTPTTLSDSPLMSNLYSLTNSINDAIMTLEDWVKQFYNLTIPRATLTMRIAEAEIPPQSPGNYIMFRATARDVDGNTMTSPIGFYYTVNKTSDTSILILDPHVWLWLLKENSNQILNTSKNAYSYGIPDEVAEPLTRVRNLSETVSTYGLNLYHHWEYLGKYYNVYIAWPKSDVADLLNTFKPNIIILSSLGLGLQGGGIWDWDLRDIPANGGSLLDTLISYIKTNHAGLIATHATLSDWIVWTSCEERVKVGARGHVGYNLSDVNIVNESSVAALLGMPELALWEYVRDAVAEAACKEQPEIGMAIGSTPLQVPYVPWNGTLRLTPEAKNLGWDLPQEFTVEMPTLLEEYGFKAYTEVGWQLALPRTLAYVAWNSSYGVNESFSPLRDRFIMLIKNITGGTVDEVKMRSYLDRGLEGGLRDFYGSLNSARIIGSTFNVSVPLGAGRSLNIPIDVDREASLSILQRMPIKIIALSPDGLAGIIVHDKFWDPSGGYRAVYFSFEVEAASGDIAEELLANAVEWVKEWQFRNTTELLGSILRVPKDVATSFRDSVAALPGKEVFSNGLILNEEGGAEVRLSLPPGRLYIVVAHPTSDVDAEVINGAARIVNATRINDVVTKVVVDVEKSGDVVLLLKAGSQVSLNSAYVTAKFEAYATTTPVTTTTTTAPTTPPITTTTSPTTATTTTTAITSPTTTATQTTQGSTTATQASTPAGQTTQGTQPSAVLVAVGVIVAVTVAVVVLVLRKR